MQAIAQALGGRVEKSDRREYGPSQILANESHPLLSKIHEWPMPVWMSHGDRVIELPEGFRSIASSRNSPHAAMANADDSILGLQFHPEVSHTPEGGQLLANFLFASCRCEPTWTMASFIETQLASIRRTVGKDR